MLLAKYFVTFQVKYFRLLTTGVLLTPHTAMKMIILKWQSNVKDNQEQDSSIVGNNEPLP